MNSPLSDQTQQGDFRGSQPFCPDVGHVVKKEVDDTQDEGDQQSLCPNAGHVVRKEVDDTQNDALPNSSLLTRTLGRGGDCNGMYQELDQV